MDVSTPHLTLALGLDDIITLIFFGVAIIGGLIGSQSKQANEKKKERERRRQHRRERAAAAGNERDTSILDELVATRRNELEMRVGARQAPSAQAVSRVDAPAALAQRLRRQQSRIVPQRRPPAPPQAPHRQVTEAKPVAAASAGHRPIRSGNLTRAGSNLPTQARVSRLRGVSLRDAVVMKEILDPPLALRPSQAGESEPAG